MNSISNKQFVFCPPLPGKPDPKQPDNPSARVAQSPQKGETCSFYALKILRNGKAVDPYSLEVQQKRRLAEKIFSTHRKMMTHLNETLNNRVDLAKQIAAACFNGLCTKTDAQNFLDQYAHVVHSESKEFLQAAVQDFCSQDVYQDFVTFAESDYQQALINAHEWCLSQLSIPEDFLKGSIPFQLGKSWQELSLEEKAGHEQNIIFNKHADIIGASKSLWHPSQPIDKLIKQLQLDGPLLIFGRFGQIYYSDLNLNF